MLLELRAGLPEAGADALEALRKLPKLASGAAQRQALAAAFVDALMFFGHYSEACGVADDVLRKVHNTLISAN